jgi:hypothetical protein
MNCEESVTTRPEEVLWRIYAPFLFLRRSQHLDYTASNNMNLEWWICKEEVVASSSTGENHEKPVRTVGVLAKNQRALNKSLGY